MVRHIIFTKTIPQPKKPRC